MGEVNKENLDEAALSEKRKSDFEAKADDGGGGSRKKHKTGTRNPGTVPEAKGEGNEEEEEEEEDSDEEDEGCEEEEGASESSEEDVDDGRKGKGILKGDIGKGKLKVEEESGSDDDGGNSSDGDSDLSDDPLLEVDLNNILPSRTRRRVTPQTASFLAADLDDDSDCDDSDA